MPPEQDAEEPALEIAAPDENASPGVPDQPPVNLPVEWNDSPSESEETQRRGALQTPEMPGSAKTLAKVGRYQTRLETARTRLRDQAEPEKEWAALVEQAIALLDSISQHPALTNYAANKRKLDEVEQRLGYGAYPQ